MVEIQRKMKDKGKVTCRIYTEEEARDLNLSPVPWRLAHVGDWAITDDGYVSECCGRSTYTDKHGAMRTYIRLTCGVGWDNGFAKISFLENHKHGTYTKANPTKGWEEHEANKTRTKNMITAYAQMVIGDGGVDFDVLGDIYRPDQKIPRATVKRFLKQKTIQNMIEEKIQELLEKKDVNKEFALDNILRALQMSESKGDINNFLKANDYIMDLLDMKPSKKMITDTIQVDVSKQIADTIAKEDKRLTVQRKSEEDDV